MHEVFSLARLPPFRTYDWIIDVAHVGEFYGDSELGSDIHIQ